MFTTFPLSIELCKSRSGEVATGRRHLFNTGRLLFVLGGKLSEFGEVATTLFLARHDFPHSLLKSLRSAGGIGAPVSTSRVRSFS